MTVDDAVVHAIFEREFPDWTLEAWREADEGTDFVAILDCEGSNRPRETADCASEIRETRRRVVLKVQDFLDPVSFRPEPRLVRLVSERTNIAVPEILAMDLGDEEFPPYFFMKYVEGDQPNSLDELSDPVLERVAREAGTHLAQIHEMATWDAYGTLRHEDDVEEYEGRTPGGLAVMDPADSWRDSLGSGAEGQLDRYGDRFADLEAPLRDAALDVLDDVPAQPQRSLVNGDYRLGNLLIDSETGETRAVLDWGNQFTGDPAFDCVKAEDYLCGFAPRDSPRRVLVRDAIRDGYRERRALTLDQGRRDAYLLHSRIPALAWFDLWYGDAENPSTSSRNTARSSTHTSNNDSGDTSALPGQNDGVSPH